jgi:arylsulfatase A-like enzyme
LRVRLGVKEGLMKSQAKKPNFLLIVVDDMGYSDCEPFGGEIRTPNLVKLADEGVRFRHFYSSSLCAPTRSLLMTGVDNHLNGLGIMPPMHSVNQFMKPGYEGTLNANVATIAELLGDAGYYTCMAGKWHLGKNDGQRPEDRGFHRVFSFLGGGASHFSDAKALSPSEQPHTVYDEDGRDVANDLPADFYSTTSYTDKMIEFLRNKPRDKPFFGYLAYTAPHDPLQVPDEWLDRYKGEYDDGYPAMRNARTRRMKSMGLIREDMDINPATDHFERWENLSDEEQRSQARKMEICAAMIEILDEGIGRSSHTSSRPENMTTRSSCLCLTMAPIPRNRTFTPIARLQRLMKYSTIAGRIWVAWDHSSRSVAPGRKRATRRCPTSS